MTYEDIEYVDYDKVRYKGVIFKVSGEFIQDSYAGSISWEQIEAYILEKYNKSITVVRNKKLKELGI